MSSALRNLLMLIRLRDRGRVYHEHLLDAHVRKALRFCERAKEGDTMSDAPPESLVASGPPSPVSSHRGDPA
jgi:hypothetical protein